MTVIGWILAIVFVAGLAIAGCIAVANDEDSMAPVVVASHQYECMDHDYCGGGYGRGGYEDERGSRNGRDKKTCFFGCDNIIIVPGLPGMGGGEGGGEPR